MVSRWPYSNLLLDVQLASEDEREIHILLYLFEHQDLHRDSVVVIERDMVISENDLGELHGVQSRHEYLLQITQLDEMLPVIVADEDKVERQRIVAPHQDLYRLLAAGIDMLLQGSFI